MSGWSMLLPFGTALLAVLVGLVSLADAQGEARTVVAALFLVVGPGLPWVYLLRLPDATARITLTVALSLALDLLVATLLFYAGWWSWRLAVGVLLLVSLSGSGLALIVDQIAQSRAASAGEGSR